MYYGRLGILLSCFVVVGGISGATNRKSFSSVVESQTFIESAIQIKDVNIRQTLPYSTIYHVLEEQCSAESIKDAQQLFEAIKPSRTNNIRPHSLEREMDRRFTLLKNLIPSIKENDEWAYCKQKYLTYSLLEYTQGLYLGTQSPVPTATNNLPPAPPLLQTPIEQVLPPATNHGSAEQIQYLHIINNNKQLTDQFSRSLSQITEKYLQKEVGKLIALGFLTAADLAVLDGNIEVNYIPGCGMTRGSYHMIQRTDGSNKRFKQIKLNISLCEESFYLDNLENYVRQIFIHEIAHYLYYFKDSNSEQFGNFCWKNGTSTCAPSDFVSVYAMRNREEDYAESFTHRYLTITSQTRITSPQEHGSADTSSSIREAKAQYFNVHFPSISAATVNL